ncbi:MAG TPA: hypothetical protein GXX17_01945 [Clostridiales bacterium]|nr:hypothetical protein [Clostridiales bacterium]
MTLYELGLEYLWQSNLVRRRIRKLTPCLKNLCADEQQELKRRINLLYAAALECKRIGEYLINYKKEE